MSSLAANPLQANHPLGQETKMNIKKKPKLSFDVRDKGCLKESLENNSDDESTGFNIIPDNQ